MHRNVCGGRKLLSSVTTHPMQVSVGRGAVRMPRISCIVVTARGAMMVGQQHTVLVRGTVRAAGHAGTDSLLRRAGTLKIMIGSGNEITHEIFLYGFKSTQIC